MVIGNYTSWVIQLQCNPVTEDLQQISKQRKAESTEKHFVGSEPNELSLSIHHYKQQRYVLVSSDMFLKKNPYKRIKIQLLRVKMVSAGTRKVFSMRTSFEVCDRVSFTILCT
ncbi:hypothetical protein AVEN_47580-1 [Araneus ventricosus]|uniref:Uncharacterized protein n=1 Tax=Araneus ventricosus TaxID=182803 RepID=A0A4Y2DK58_ARAVE|nr:hypothetical protein AVEN_47580-1 [Araneus ventricosus]